MFQLFILTNKFYSDYRGKVFEWYPGIHVITLQAESSSIFLEKYLPLPDFCRKIEEDSARRVGIIEGLQAKMSPW